MAASLTSEEMASLRKELTKTLESLAQTAQENAVLRDHIKSLEAQIIPAEPGSIWVAKIVAPPCAEFHQQERDNCNKLQEMNRQAMAQLKRAVKTVTLLEKQLSEARQCLKRADVEREKALMELREQMTKQHKSEILSMQQQSYEQERKAAAEFRAVSEERSALSVRLLQCQQQQQQQQKHHDQQQPVKPQEQQQQQQQQSQQLVTPAENATAANTATTTAATTAGGEQTATPLSPAQMALQFAQLQKQVALLSEENEHLRTKLLSLPQASSSTSISASRSSSSREMEAEVAELLRPQPPRGGSAVRPGSFSGRFMMGSNNTLIFRRPPLVLAPTQSQTHSSLTTLPASSSSSALSLSTTMSSSAHVSFPPHSPIH